MYQQLIFKILPYNTLDNDSINPGVMFNILISKDYNASLRIR